MVLHGFFECRLVYGFLCMFRGAGFEGVPKVESSGF